MQINPMSVSTGITCRSCGLPRFHGPSGYAGPMCMCNTGALPPYPLPYPPPKVDYSDLLLGLKSLLEVWEMNDKYSNVPLSSKEAALSNIRTRYLIRLEELLGKVPQKRASLDLSKFSIWKDKGIENYGQ